ncbi:MAG TPA: hypothetical protein VIH61_05700, partial [Waddliaceae bacterium]
EVWSDFLSERPSDRFIVDVGHSQGAIHSRHSLEHSDEEVRKRVFCLLVAPGAHVNRDICGEAKHFESERDFVPLFDYLLGGTRNCGPIIRLEPHPDAPLFDHFIDSPTYAESIQDTILHYIQQNGASL